ncbi:UNVERIFIED_CONTAM: Aluminum-activated malate transporter 12 [Sesamum radiatum]|uniref:Aluminum-activated malate transporter 12 n=1 Tax=Sesamum radiatum TaxID=300843 RepID=A0AAW2LAT2_SESRA
MYSGIAVGFGGENPYDWTAKIEAMKKRSNVFIAETRTRTGSAWRTVCRVGQDDPRRLIHSLKVGLSLTLVSLLYLMEPLFQGIGQSAIWAVMTVVVVLEFTAGATLCKGLNRGIGTLLAGSLAFLLEYIAQESGRGWQLRDRIMVIFLLTFNLITISSFRVHNVHKIAHDRLYTIAIGCGICLLMSLLIFPNWSGQDLHNSTVSKLEGLAISIEGCVNEYFSSSEAAANTGEDRAMSEDPIYKGYKAVLDSKSSDETLALHASWEPCHSRHCYKFPWKQYVKLGDVLRHFGYTLVALHGCLHTQIQTPTSVRALFKDPCVRVAGEVSKALVELANSIREHRQCSPVILSDHLHEALHDLDAALRSQPRLFLGRSTNATTNVLALAAAASSQKPSKNSGVSLSSVKTDSSALLEWKKSKRVEAAERKVLRPTLSKISITSLEFSEALPFAAFASLLVEAVARLDLVIEEVEELGRVANFREFSEGDDQVSVVCQKPEKGSGAVPMENHLPCHVADC